MTELFPERLRELRKKRGLSRKTLAELSGIASNRVSVYERGEHSPTIETAAKLADFLGVSMDYLCGRGETKQK